MYIKKGKNKEKLQFHLKINESNKYLDWFSVTSDFSQSVFQVVHIVERTQSVSRSIQTTVCPLIKVQ